MSGVRSGGTGALELQLDPNDMGRLLRDVKAFDVQLAKDLRKRIREVADPAVQAVRHRILSGTSHSNTGLRRGLAAGTKLSIRTSVKAAGVSIVTSGAKLPAGKQGMVRTYDKASFRHPVFGHRDRWVSQRGRPFFGTTIDPKRAEFAAAIERALLDAAATIRGAEVTGS